jgi:hypothetical protein
MTMRARRLGIRFEGFEGLDEARSLAVAAGNIPPRHSPDTWMPASRTMLTALVRPAAASLSRQIPILGIPARAQPSMASCRLQDWVVA